MRSGELPRNNVAFLSALSHWRGAFLLLRWPVAKKNYGYDLGAKPAPLPARLIAFMGVNAAAFVRYYLHERGKEVRKFLAPAGAGLC